MKKFAINILIAIFTLTIANFSLAANWRLIFKTNNAEIYIDQSSISNTGTEKTILIKSNVVQGERSPSSLELKYLVNCVANEVSLIGAKQFKNLDLQGDGITLNTTTPLKPTEAKPGTAANAYVKAVCEQPRLSAPNSSPNQATQTSQRQAPPTQPTQRASTGVSLVDMSSMASSVGSCESILEVAAQRAAADYQVSNNLRALSQKFMDLGNRLNAKNSNDGVLYINSKNDAYQNATNATQADLNASVSRCVKLSN